VRRYILTGIVTAVPILVTWLVFEFVLSQLLRFGTPLVLALYRGVHAFAPEVAQTLLEPWFQPALAVVLTLILLYLLGLATTWVVGKRVIAFFEGLVARLPLVTTIYGSTKKLLDALRQKPESLERVVLINFPSRDMKAVGFVTKIMKDTATGQELAAVYVPTAPNPTSGYMQIVPVDQVISTNWSMDEAMTFVITGGAVAPESIEYTKACQIVPTEAVKQATSFSPANELITSEARPALK
jgi:uncharacterized membrane protein